MFGGMFGQSRSLRRGNGQVLDGVNQILHYVPKRKEVIMAHFKVQSGSVIASPNIIPMADIMLVLLIIFMVVTPMLQPGIPVDLAKVTNPIDMPNADKDDAVIVAISSDGSVFLGNTRMAVDDITSQVRDRISGRLDKSVFIKSDARTKYGDVVRVVDKVRSSGVDSVGLLTDKSAPRMPPPPVGWCGNQLCFAEPSPQLTLPQQNVSTADVLAEEQRLWKWKWEEKRAGPWPR
jgi:biopolymer transport protein ExbD/biopolymer transport protein TolR